MNDLPGDEIVRQGLEDLKAGRETPAALLVSIASTRLRAAGIGVPTEIPEAEHRLYRLLARAHGNEAHSRYNAWIRRLVSFERALECVS